MGNLSSLTMGDTTFPVLAGGGGGGSDMPIHIQLPKSASDSTYSGLDMLAWPNGMRYVYATSESAGSTAFIPPEYMGVGSVYIREAEQFISNVTRSGNQPITLIAFSAEICYNSVIGDATNGATVSFDALRSGTATSGAWSGRPGSSCMTFYVNPNVSP